MTSGQEDLSKFRAQIDAIDDKIIDMLKDRMEIVHQVGKHKSQTSRTKSFIRAGREATMLRNLTKKSAGVFPPEAIATIWRMIISTSLNTEQKMTVCAHTPPQDATCYWLAREYFGAFIPMVQEPSAEKVIADVASGAVGVGVLPLMDMSYQPWWVRPTSEKNDLYVFARIPFIERKEIKTPPALAIANVIPEPTEEDVSLFAVFSDKKEAELLQLFQKVGLAVLVLASDQKGNYLIETKNFVAIGDARIEQMQRALPKGATIRLLGAYAVPLTV